MESADADLTSNTADSQVQDEAATRREVDIRQFARG